MKNKVLIIFLVAFVFGGSRILAQSEQQIDSIQKKIKDPAWPDTAKINAYLYLLQYYRGKDPDSAHHCNLRALALSQKSKFKRGLFASYLNLGLTAIYKGSFDSAVYFCNEAMYSRDHTVHKKNIALNFNIRGAAYYKKGDYSKALRDYLDAAETFEELNDAPSTSMVLNNVGLIYHEQKQSMKALNAFRKCAQISLQTKNAKGLASAYNNIGLVHNESGQKDSGVVYYEKAISVAEKSNDKYMLAQALNNIGIIYLEKGDYRRAENYYRKALTFREELQDEQGISQTLMNLARTFQAGKNYDAAMVYMDRALQKARYLGIKKDLKEIYRFSSELMEEKKDYKGALEKYKLYKTYNDSLYDEGSTQQITEMSAKYESDRKDKEIQLLNKDKALKESEFNKQKAETEKQNLQRNAMMAGFVLVLALAIISFRGYRRKQKDNKLIELQKQQVEEKQKAILDSIHYAKRIQKSLLPTEKYIEKNLKG